MTLPSYPGGIFIEVDNLPLDLVIIRASEVPQRVFDGRTISKVGITGSDLIWETGMGKNYGEELPVPYLVPNAKRSRLYVGMNQELCQQIRTGKLREPSIADLSGKMVATSYPRIANEFFSERSISYAGLISYYSEYAGGKVEAMQYLYPNCEGVLEVKVGGDTANANKIETLEIFYEVTLQMIRAADKLTRQDLDILDEIKDRIAIALERRRMI